MFAIFEFPEKERNYGAGHQVATVGGENIFTANPEGGDFIVGLGSGTSRFRYTASNNNVATGLLSGHTVSRTLVLKFRVNVDTVTSLTWKFARHGGSNGKERSTNYSLSKSRLLAYGASGWVDVVMYHKVSSSPLTLNGLSTDDVRLFINGQLCETNDRTSSYVYVINDADNYLTVSPGTEISSVITYAEAKYLNTPPAWILKPHKVINLEPTAQIPQSGNDVVVTPQEFVSGFTTDKAANLKFQTNFVPVEGAKYQAVCGFGWARYVRRSPKYGTAYVQPQTRTDERPEVMSRMLDPDSMASSNRGLSLLNVGVGTQERIDGHRFLGGSEDPYPLQTVGLNVVVSPVDY